MKTELKYGFIIGVTTCLWILTEYLLGFHTTKLNIGKFSGYFAMVIPIVFIYMAFSRIRKERKEFSIFQGLKSGLIISVVAAIISTTFLFIYNHYINPQWMELAWEWEKAQMLQAGVSEAEIQKKVDQFKAIAHPTSQIIMGLSGTITMGLIISLIISFFLRKKQA